MIFAIMKNSFDQINALICFNKAKLNSVIGEMKTGNKYIRDISNAIDNHL